MSELVAPTGTVHWIGTGRSTGSGLGLICDRAERATVWGRTEAKAAACLERIGRSGQAQAKAFDPHSLAAELAAGDIVVSMLPATEHAGLLQLSIDHGAHFACSSYVSPAMSSLAPAAAQAGLVVLTECGLDPGIDHLLAHLLVDKAKAATGQSVAVARFTSYCGSFPAVPNDFRYRFSWAPRGVLTALRTEARYIDEGVEQLAPSPYEATREIVVAGEKFEVYPNRDSLPFVAAYGIPAAWRLETFVRGTLRLAGWRQAWAGVYEELLAGDEDRITALANDLARRYPTTKSDHDRVVMAVALDVEAADGRAWSGEYLLDMVGDEAEPATTRTVSVAMACGIADVLAGTMPPGLHRATADVDSAQRWLDWLAELGIRCEFQPGPHKAPD